ncbi:MAG: hypothetical protein K8T20_09915 [Planctomycetes bacterium]|nr:hypothetical protein [Planctomycetota bacterium]
MVNPSWMPPPEEFPPIPERAKNLARHFGLIALVIAVLGTPLLFTVMARSRRPNGGKSGLKQVGIWFALYESRYHAYPKDLAELTAGLSLNREEAAVAQKCGICGAEHDGWWNYRGYEPRPGDTYSWKDRLTDAAPPDLPVAWCSTCGEILFFQGRVDAADLGKGPGSAVRTMGLVRK